MKIVMALAMVLSINLMLFFVNMGMQTINPGGPTIIDYNTNLINQLDQDGNYTLPSSRSHIINELPSEPQIDEDTAGNVFTDTWNAVKNWLLEKTGINYLAGIVNAVPNFLSKIGLPTAFVYGIGAFWYMLTIFLIVAFFKGGSN